MKIRVMFLSVIVAAVAAVGVGGAPARAQTADACWGQATRVFAQFGVMGQHSASQPTPRLGLRNLARALYDIGVLEDDTMEALGSFVARELGLTIEACL